MAERLASNTLSKGHGGLYTPSGDPRNQEFDTFLRDVADRLDVIAQGVELSNAIRARELRDLGHECRVKVGLR